MVVVPQVPTQLLAKLGHGVKPAAMHEIGLERVKERLHMRVLARCAAPSHALAHAEGDQALPKRRSEILTAAIAVKDQPGRWPAAAERGVNHRAREPRVARWPRAARPEADGNIDPARRPSTTSDRRPPGT